MTEAKWLAHTHRYTLRSLCDQIHFLGKQNRNRRRLRLFASACCRRMWDLLRLDVARKIVELSEAHADGTVSGADLQAARDHPDLADMEALLRGERGDRTQFSARVIYAIEAAAFLAEPNFYSFNGGPSFVVQLTSHESAGDFLPEPGWYNGGQKWGVEFDEVELAVKAKLLHDIFGNPFRPVAFSPSWCSDTVLALASQMYESRDFSAMPILGDALQDAGCNNADMLNHCRGEGPHVRGCWVVDLVLRKK
ncbi:Uncharacterized protein OS=Sorangium cellulosum (strain So ce56) GN=sce5710 PE=4 SV=1 [Gemmata massiliana]|uniref:SMI1/KNR4 family protein n=1 Tax=Gemmata massiliana TaxID=1210884 RepID=A0A6P2CWD3_9BACT|nr:hypothetical protein [Gemmata massiliana]VTR93249.1 Uncharacterized protein OS=Sorangium cellulosum (strain So ce56) GN=sce5710 PE=4 SV=1 [Gemmata massiliana]